MKIYCPNCDSNLITLTWEDTDSYATVHTKEYECHKCGCTFEVNFIAEKNVKILNISNDKQLKER